jgi:general secretion pathway protein I
MAGDRNGEFEGGRYRYRLRIRAIADPAPVAAGPANPDLERIAPRLFEVSLQVQWGDGGTGERLDFTQIKARSLVAADIQP